MKIYTFPTFRIETQLFHVPGAGFDGGLTSGGAQFITPEPGGFGVLELAPILVDTEWQSPLVSWLLSKISGQVFRCRLAPTPQVAFSRQRGEMVSCMVGVSPVTGMPSVPWDNDQPWSNQENWNGDFTGTFASAALKGTTTLTFDLTGVGPIVGPGHVIGHDYDCYLVDEVSYVGNVGTATVTPPLRRNVASGDNAYLRPWFTGRISNGEQIRSAYNSMGHIKPGNIILQEAIV